MKKSLLILMLTLTGLSVLAKPVEPETAVRVARNFALSQLTEKQRAQLGKEPFADAQVVYTHAMPKSDKAAMYVVNLGSAFVIVSADDVAHPVLGYSMSREWPVKQALPSQVTSYLDDLAGQIAAATSSSDSKEMSQSSSSPSPVLGEVSEGQRGIYTEWQQLLTFNSSLLTTTNLPDSVGPLLTTTWDQGQYYNALCPEDANGPDGHVYTGCVATAMAQIINYWGYPVHGRGIHSYETNYGTLSVNYDSASYDYAHMPSALTATSTPQEVSAVATLMRDCGVAANMGYGPSESGAYAFEARTGFVNFFRFSSDLGYAERSYYSDSEWDSLLHEDLVAGRPVYYSGRNDNNGGHSFVCDGYKQNGYKHFNFGWSGYADGWYLTEAVNPSTYEFNSVQAAFFGIAPGDGSNVILGQTQGTNTFTINESLEFCHLLGRNRYMCTNWFNSCENKVILSSNDPNNHLVVDIMQYVYDGVLVWNDTAMTALLRNIVDQGGGTFNYNPILSTSNTITLQYYGHVQREGFHLHIQKDGDCRIVSDVEYINQDSTSVRLSWHENGNSNEWQIEYGQSGFLHGEGTSLIADTNTLTVDGLTFLQQYDFYIRPTCGERLWRKIEVVPDKPYWHNAITRMPDGYVENPQGDIYIYSSEAFAWLNSIANGFNGEVPHDFKNVTIHLMNNIDMSGKKWQPISFFRGVFDGHNHIINGLYINEPQRCDVGLFRVSKDSAVIKDVTLNGASISGKKNVGGFVGSSSGSDGTSYGGSDGILFSNCHSNAIVCGYSSIGALAGDIHHAKILNCSSSGEILGSQAVGGLFGNLAISRCENAFSLSNIELDSRYVSSFCPAWYRGGLIGLAHGDTISNCYASGIVSHDLHEIYELPGKIIGSVQETNVIEYIYGYDNNNNSMQLYGTNYGNAMVSDTSVFFKSGNYLNLATPVLINNQEYTELLSALNAWVDANNTDEQYRHWAADSTGENGGFPVFAAIPCTPASSSDSITVCDSYSWHGTVYTADAILTDTLSTMDGCDSIISHHLTVNHGTTKTDTASAIDSYSWADSTYTTSGIYQRTWRSANSCDSTVTLWLTITQTVHDTTYVPDTTLTPVIVYDTTLRDTVVYNLIPHDSIVYTLIPQDSIVYTLIPRDSVVYTLIPKDSIVYTLIDRDSIVYTLIPRDSSVYTFIPRDSIVYTLIERDSTIYNLTYRDSTVFSLIARDSVVYNIIPRDSIVYGIVQQDSIVYTLTYRDTTVYNITNVDTTVYNITHLDTTIYVPSYIDTAIYNITNVDTTIYVPNYIDTTIHVPVYLDSIVYNISNVDTTVYNITNVDTTVYNITHVDTTIYVPTYIDTTIHVPVYLDSVVYNISNVDTTIYNITNVDTTVYNITHVDTTVFVPTYVDTTVYNITVVDTVVVDSTLVPVVDTLWLHDTIHYSIFVHDTIVIHDTIVVGIDDIETIDAKIYSSNRHIVVEGAGSNTVRLYDINGRILATKQDDYAPLRFDVHASGTYMIKIGNHPARKVVVIR